MAIEPRFVRNFLLWSLQPGDSLRDALAHGKGEDYPVCLGRRAAFFPYFVHTCCWVVQASHWKYRFGVVKYRRLYILEIVTIHAGSPYLYLPTSTLGCDRGIFNGSSRYGSNTFLPSVSYVVLHFWAMHIYFTVVDICSQPSIQGACSQVARNIMTSWFAFYLPGLKAATRLAVSVCYIDLCEHWWGGVTSSLNFEQVVLLCFLLQALHW